MRRKLNELCTVYLQIEQAVDREAVEVDPWLPETREGCLALAEGLPRIRWPGLFALVSLALPVGAALSKLPGWVGYLFLGFAGALPVLVWFGYATVRDSYRYKRSIFLPNAPQVDKYERAQQEKVRKDNIYAFEDELFAALRREKKRERAVDWLLFSLTYVVMIEAALGLLWCFSLIAYFGSPGSWS